MLVNIFITLLHVPLMCILTFFYTYIKRFFEVMVVVFNATFNNILVIMWWSVLLVEKTTDLLQVRQILSHNVVSSTSRLSGIQTHVSGDRH